MNNTNEILERILLNMKYDSKKTLTENTGEVKNGFILEQQQIPTTMNQIMQFQSWVWKNVDKLGDPSKADKNKLYTTSLCSKPCTIYGKNVYNRETGHYHKEGGAIDGSWGGNTKKLWNTYKEKYKEENPSWDRNDSKTADRVLGKTIPTTMNQIMQFQMYVWEKVDRLGNPDNADKNKKYTTSLCDQPCTPFNRRINGKIYSGAIDGRFGGNTKKLWDTYKSAYQKENPNWNADDIKTREKVLGKTIPTTETEIKNFQRYYLEEIEKQEKPVANVFTDTPESKLTTKLCDKPCLYNEAVDGVWGDKTKALWEKHKDEYQKENNLWAVSIEWDKKTQDAENLYREKVDLAPLLRWSISNPSGWNMSDTVPDFDADNGGYPDTKNTYPQPNECPWYWGWDLHNNIFPYPKEYTKDIIEKVKSVTKEEQAREDAALDQQAKEQRQLEQDIKAGDGPTPSDRLGMSRYRPDPLGVGPTKAETRQLEFNTEWNKKIEEAKNHILHAVNNWNNELKAVKAAIPQRCKRPIKITPISDKIDDASYISYSTICKNRGGLWVYNVGTNQEICSCRYMLGDGLNYEGSLSVVNGSKGTFETGTGGSMAQIMAYQTEGTGMMDVEKRADSHETNMWLELGLMAAGFVALATGVGAPLAPLFFGAATAAGVADGAKYIQEGDTHMGVMLISLSLLGVPEVASAFRLVKGEIAATKYIAKTSVGEFKTLIRKSIANPDMLTAAEKLAIKEIKAAGITVQRYLGQNIRKQLGKNLVENLPKVSATWSTKDVYKFLLKLATEQPKFKSMVIYILGVPYTIDQIYLALYGNDLDRQRSGIGMLWDWLHTKGYSPNFTSVPSNEDILNSEKEKQVKDLILTKLIAELQNTSMKEELIQELLSSNQAFISNLMTDKQLEEWARSENINTGFDQEKYDELVAKQKEEEKRIKNLEGCNQLDSLKTLATGDDAAYVKIDNKFVFIKEKAKSENKDDFVNGKCNGEEFFYQKINKTKDSDFDFMKQVQRDTKNLAQNPDYNEVNEDYRLQKIIRKNIKRYL